MSCAWGQYIPTNAMCNVCIYMSKGQMNDTGNKITATIYRQLSTSSFSHHSIRTTNSYNCSPNDRFRASISLEINNNSAWIFPFIPVSTAACPTIPAVALKPSHSIFILQLLLLSRKWYMYVAVVDTNCCWGGNKLDYSLLATRTEKIVRRGAWSYHFLAWLPPFKSCMQLPQDWLNTPQ